MIPDSFIESLIARLDIVDVVQGYVPSLHKAGTNYLACCPFHTEKTPSFTVSQSKQRYHCFGCGVHGDVVQFVTEFTGMHFVEVIETLAARIGLKLPTEVASNAKDYKEIYAILSQASAFFENTLKGPLGARPIDYLKNRGLTSAIAKEYALGYADNTWDSLLKALGNTADRLKCLRLAGLLSNKDGREYDRFRDRIMFPIRDKRGRVIGFGGRVIDQGEPKYLNSPETPVFNKGMELYGLYEARLRERNLTSLMVVEGYLDVLSLVQFGISNVVATLGTALTDKHVESLFRQAPEIFLCFDGDKAGQAAALRALHLFLPQMKEGRRLKFMLLPEKEDPDSYVRKQGREGFVKAMEKAKALPDFLFQTLATGLDLNHIDGRAQFVTLAKPLIAKLPAGVYQQMMFERLAELSKLSLDTFLPKPKVSTKYSSPYFPQRGTQPPLTSLVMRANALLLAHRHLLKHINIEDVKDIEAPGISLLCAIISILQKGSSMSEEALLQQLSPELASLYKSNDFKLISAAIPKGDEELEFVGTVARLKRRMQEQIMEGLLSKSKTGELSSIEKEKLAFILSQKENIS